MGAAYLRIHLKHDHLADLPSLVGERHLVSSCSAADEHSVAFTQHRLLAALSGHLDQSGGFVLGRGGLVESRSLDELDVEKLARRGGLDGGAESVGDRGRWRKEGCEEVEVGVDLRSVSAGLMTWVELKVMRQCLPESAPWRPVPRLRHPA